ncbi:hypothetical protein [Agromyces sp. LHK192]|uniref:hypothetical protein n=1 Tax=Agromyces sp. LHK192 TaxID=2498704 RepID=UPI000FD7A74B|nr:hypothetical protein [Agromyces sp. LHK192]
MSRVQEFVEVWPDESGEPKRLVWRGRRFRVSDRPTPLVGPAEWWEPFAGHDVSPGRHPLSIADWRFQAGTEDGETHMFDVGRDGDRWRVLGVFD